MNILYLHAHDVGRFASVYGADIETPNLERFASSGATVFENAYSVAPTCSPSRVALLTGQYPHQQNMMGLTHLGHSMSNPERHIAAWLGENGYTTSLCGLHHEFPREDHESIPYDYEAELNWGGGTGPRDLSAARRAQDWLNRHDGSKPFFLSVGFFWPHVPLPEVEIPAESNAIAPWPDVEAGCLDTAAFKVAMEHTDQCMGMVLDALEESPFAENTAVFITTDHGVPFPLNKATLHDRGTGVLFMLRAPKKRGRKRSKALVSHLDFFPTVCELTKLDKPEWLEGESLLPVLKGEETVREGLLTTTNHHVEYEPSRSIRTRTHRLIHRFVSGPRSRPNVDATRLKDHAEREGFFDQNTAEFELYDLINDPEELENLANKEEHQELLGSLVGQLRDLMEKSSDPLLEKSKAEAFGS